MVIFCDFGVFLPLEDSFEDGDLEGVEVLAAVLVDDLIQLFDQQLRIHG